MLDFDGDGVSDLATFEDQHDGSANELLFRVTRSASGQLTAIEFGNSADRAAPGDYDGDGLWDYAYIREAPATGLIWRVRDSYTGTAYDFSFGNLGDVALAGCDFKGKLRTSPAVLRDGALSIYDLSNGVAETIALSGLSAKLISQATCADLDGDKKQELLLLINEAPPAAAAKPVAAYRKKSQLLVYSAGGQELRRASVTGAERVLAFDVNGDGQNEIAWLKRLRNDNFNLMVLQAGVEVAVGVGRVLDIVSGSFGAGRDGLYLWQTRLSKITFPERSNAQSALPRGSSFLQAANLHFTGGFNPEDPNGVCPQVLSAFDGPNGFLWKASDAHGGTLVVVLPRQYRKFRSVSVMKDGYMYGNLYFAGIANGNRQHWRSRVKARSYPDRSLVVAKTRVPVVCWKIGSSARRND